MAEKYNDEFREGLKPALKFIEAANGLESEGFKIELWVTKKGRVMLRWVKRGSKWHVSSKDTNGLRAALDQLGTNALQWLQARRCGTGHEENYAVNER